MSNQLPKPHPNAERLSSWDYEEKAKKPSSYVSGEMVDDPENSYGVCPACRDRYQPILDHFETRICKCGLNMQVRGASLYIWR